MTTLVIENVKDDLHMKIQTQARANSRSTEEEVHLLLQKAMAASPSLMPGGFSQVRRAVSGPYDKAPSSLSGDKYVSGAHDYSIPQWDPLG